MSNPIYMLSLEDLTEILDKIYHKGRVIETTDEDFDPNGILPGTWEKSTSYSLNKKDYSNITTSTTVSFTNSEIPVTGNGHCLVVTSGSQYGSIRPYSYAQVGESATWDVSTGQGVADTTAFSSDNIALGIPTKAQLGSSNYYKTGLIATITSLSGTFSGTGSLSLDAIKTYRWLRTA